MKCVWLPESIGSSLDPPWSNLELHLSGDEDLRDQGARVVTKEGYRCGDGGACKVVGWLLDDMVVRS
ncbi:hypothetical protein Tco_0745296 [Tanacetum coccineum]